MTWAPLIAVIASRDSAGDGLNEISKIVANSRRLLPLLHRVTIIAYTRAYILPYEELLPRLRRRSLCWETSKNE